MSERGLKFTSKLFSFITLIVLTAIILVSGADGEAELEFRQVSFENFPQVNVLLNLKGKRDVKITQRNIEVIESGERQKIDKLASLKSFRQQIHVVLAVDLSSSMWGKLGGLRKGAKAFIDNLRVQDRVALMGFSGNRTRIIQGFTSSQPKLKDVVDSKITPTSLAGETPLYDALIRSTDILKGKEGPKFVILLTDGQDSASKHGFTEAIDYAKDNGITVYSIGLGDYIREKFLTEVSNKTGGQLALSPTPEDLSRVYKNLQREIKKQYQLIYTSSNTDRSKLERQLKVKVKTGRAVGELSATKTYHLPKLSFDANLSKALIEKENSVKVNGRITDSKGKPVKGKEIKLELIKNGQVVKTKDALSDSSGSYSASFKPAAGEYVLETSLSFAGEQKVKRSTFEVVSSLLEEARKSFQGDKLTRAKELLEGTDYLNEFEGAYLGARVNYQLYQENGSQAGLKKSRTLVNKALSIKEDLSAKTLKGNVLYEMDELKEALSLYQDVVSRKKDPQILGKMASVSTELGNFNQAATYYQKATELAPNDISLRIEAARAWEKIGNSRKALELLTDARKLKPEDAELNLRIANLQRKVGNLEKALETIEETQEFAPKNPQILVEKGKILGKLGKIESATQVLDTALKLAPDDPQVKRAVGDAYLEMDKLEKALSYYQNALALDPQNVRIRKKITSLLISQGKLDRALSQVNKALKMDPGNVKVLVQKAKILGMMDEVEEALDVVNEATALAPEDPQVLKTRNELTDKEPEEGPSLDDVDSQEPPKISIQGPKPKTITNSKQGILRVFVRDNVGVTKLNFAGKEKKMGRQKQVFLTKDLTYQEGKNELTVTAFDKVGNETSQTVTVISDTTGPQLEVEPSKPTYTNKNFFDLNLSASDRHGLSSLNLLGEEIKLDGESAQLKRSVNLKQGENSFSTTLQDRAGNVTTASFEIIRDKQKPTLKILAPEQGTVTDKEKLNIKIRASDNYPLQTLWVNGEKKDVPANRTDYRTTFETALNSGENELSLKVKDRAGNVKEGRFNVFFDDLKPDIELEKKLPEVTKNDVLSISFKVKDNRSLKEVQLNGKTLDLPQDKNTLTKKIDLQKGENQISIRATDSVGNSSRFSASVFRDVEKPRLEVLGPKYVNEKETTLQVKLEDNYALKNLKVRDETFQLSGTDRSKEISLKLKAGQNSIPLTVTDSAGNEAELTAEKIVDTSPPKVEFVSPKGEVEKEQATIELRLEDSTGLNYLTINGEQVGIERGETTLEVQKELNLDIGSNPVKINLTDLAGNQLVEEFGVIRVKRFFDNKAYLVEQEKTFTSIQKAISSAKSGNTIRVGKGTYRGHFNIGKDIKLVGEDQDRVILEGKENNKPVISLSPSKGKVIIQSITVTGAQTTDKYLNNTSAIFVTEASKSVIRNVTLTKNALGLLATKSSYVKMDNCLLKKNGSEDKGIKYPVSGAVALTRSSKISITNSNISRNASGVMAFMGSKVKVLHSEIRDNRGGIWAVLGAEATGSDNKFTNNRIPVVGNISSGLWNPPLEGQKNRITYPNESYASLQEALNSLSTGGTLFLEPGKYKHPLTLSKDVTIKSKTKRATLTAPYLPVSAVKGANVRLVNIEIRGTGAGIILGEGAKAKLDNTSVLVSHLGSSGSLSQPVGILVEKNSPLVVRNSQLKYLGEYRSGRGLYMVNYSGRVSIQDSKVMGFSWGISDDHFAGKSRYNLEVHGSEFKGNGYSMALDSIGHGNITKTKFIRNERPLSLHKGVKLRGQRNLLLGNEKKLSPTYPGDPWPEGFLKTVRFTNMALKKIVRRKLDKKEEKIYPSELMNIETLNVAESSIKDLSNLQYMVNLRSLNLGANGLKDISALKHLKNVENLYLSYNRIKHISPLVSLSKLNSLYLKSNNLNSLKPLLKNKGLGEGDLLDIRKNGLDLSEDSKDMQVIKKLQQRGVKVKYKPQKERKKAAIQIPDSNLEEVLRKKLDKEEGPLYSGDMENMVKLDLGKSKFADNKAGSRIKSLRGLQYCNNLEVLLLKNNAVSDLSPLSSVTKLKTLSIRANNVSNISPLSNLKNLKSLELSENDITNISHLSNLTSLKELLLRKTNISDISPISRLTNLRRLSLGNNNISNISLLSNFTNLRELFLEKNNISDISPIAKLTDLRELSLGNNNISNLSSMSNLSNLKWLLLQDNKITDFSPLSDLKNLKLLDLSSNEITDISPLSELRNLRKLSLWNNKISNISSLSSLENLEDLGLSENNLSDLSPLLENEGLGEGDKINLKNNYLYLSEGSEDMQAINKLQERGVEVIYEPQKKRKEKVAVNVPDQNLKKAIRGAIDKPEGKVHVGELKELTELDLRHGAIENLEGIQYCKNLEKLDLGDNNISDLSPLSGLKDLEKLHLWSNKISDISPLSGLTNLWNLDLDGNKISDISPLSGLTNLRKLYLDGNKISDISSLLDNEGLLGSEIDLKKNLLELSEGSKDMQVINKLQERGVKLEYKPQQEKEQNEDRVSLTNLALESKGAEAEAKNYGTYSGNRAVPGKAIDGDAGTKWGGTSGDYNWLLVQLNKVYTISKIKVMLGYHTLKYYIEVSQNGEDWQTVMSKTKQTGSHYTGGRSVKEFTFSPKEAQFVRMVMTETNAPYSHIWQYIVKEIQVYGR